MINQAVILAGGRGERLRPLTDSLPKPMISIHGKPFLEYLITLLRDNGINDILILTGYLHESIEKHFKTGEKYGVNITYSYNPMDIQTGLRLKLAESKLKETFLLMYGDNYWPLQAGDLWKHYKAWKFQALMTVFSNHDNSSKNNVMVSSDHVVKFYDKLKIKQNLNGVDIGFFVLKKNLIRLMSQENRSLSDEFIPLLVKKKLLGAYVTNHKYYSLTDKTRIPALRKYLKKRKIIFLDRDGVINKKAPRGEYITKLAEFEYLPDALSSLSRISKKGYEIYIITNQPGIIRKKMTLTDLKKIHHKIKKDCKDMRINLKGIYTCLHGWDDGCFCRKPNPGLLFEAASDHAINLGNTFLIGDDERDILAGNAVGSRTFLVSSELPLSKIVTKYL